MSTVTITGNVIRKIGMLRFNHSVNVVFQYSCANGIWRTGYHGYHLADTVSFFTIAGIPSAKDSIIAVEDV